jgi:HK97 gp10 family phage protein
MAGPGNNKNVKITWNGQHYKGLFKKAADQGASDLADGYIWEAQGFADRAGVRDTGYLIDDSWKKQRVAPGLYEAYSDADYSVYNEFGTYKMPARPFARPAFVVITQHAKKILMRAFKTYLPGN